jgi:hypothetical protein
MNWWQWAIVGWFAGLACFVVGCWWGGRKVGELEAENVALTARVARQAEELARQALVIATLPGTDHTGCKIVIGRLSSYLTWQEHRIDQLEHEQARDGFDPVAEAEQILDRGERP